MIKPVLLIGILFYAGISAAQDYTFGWQGDPVMPDTVLLQNRNWILNQSDPEQGDSCYVTSDTALHLHWRFGPGARPKFAQCYMVLSVPVDLSDRDVIGIDIRGMEGKSWIRNVELKFESGSHQAAFTWENLGRLDRWAEKLVILKKQFSGYQTFPWNSVTILSFAVTMNATDLTDNQEDSGTVSFRNLVSQSSADFVRAGDWEPLVDFSEGELETIRSGAASAIRERQSPQGLLTTWLQDGSSWLYGQGLALRVLTEEGIWNGNAAVNDYAVAATALAHFLATHQSGEGYWPRAWNAESGNIIVNLEGDNTVWMGDFPWIPGSLANYCRKSGDGSVIPAISKARSFLYQLIEPSGRVNTLNIMTRQYSEVSNYEGYAAVLYSLLELGDTITAKQVMDYVMNTGWDEQLRFWKEGPMSFRPVLLVNTWLAALARELGYPAESTDALSLAGKLLYTRGPGLPYGFDGVGPVATWFEGTLSYIAAQGPGSNTLFGGIKEYINPDGTVPAYNDNLGSMAGIWAVDWSSLDATSWLYFAAAQKVPFGYTGADPDMFSALIRRNSGSSEPEIYFRGNSICIVGDFTDDHDPYQLSVYAINGMLLGSGIYPGDQAEVSIPSLTGRGLHEGSLCMLILTRNGRTSVRKVVYRGGISSQTPF